MRHWAWIAIVALVGMATPDTALAQSDRRAQQVSRETRTLAIGANGELNLETVSGDVTVSAGGSTDAVVEIVRDSRGRTDADAKLGLDRVRVQVDAGGARATVRAIYPNENRAPYSVNVSYLVKAPQGTRVNVEVVSGDITATGIHGGVSLRTVSGSLHVSDARRIGALSTVSGDVTVQASKVEGPIDARTTSGDIHATDVSASRVVFNTVSGGLILERVTSEAITLSSTSGEMMCRCDLVPRARYELQAHSGSIRLILGGAAGFELNAQSFSGSIRTGPGLQIPTGTNRNRRERQTMRGTVGDGSAYISATTFSGDISIEKP
jgi:DUF4097 and DUF4098 domain-containing protein YvlB